MIAKTNHPVSIVALVRQGRGINFKNPLQDVSSTDDVSISQPIGNKVHLPLSDDSLVDEQSSNYLCQHTGIVGQHGGVINEIVELRAGSGM